MGLYVTEWYSHGWWPSVWGFIISTILFVVVSYFTSPEENMETFFARIKEGLEKHNLV